MNPEHGKKTYDAIPIPEELQKRVELAIHAETKEERRMRYEQEQQKEQQQPKQAPRRTPLWRGCAAAAAVVLLAGTVGLNTSPAFASEMQKLPVVGKLAEVLTFRSFHGTEGDVNIDMDVPEIQLKTDASLPAEVNAEIRRIADAYLETAKAEFAAYKEAFFATGGTEAEWAGRTMDVFIDYDVKYLDENILSLELITAKGWVSAEEEHHFYTIDLAKDTPVTLESLLGADYIARCNESITRQIEERLAADDSLTFFGYGADADSTDGFTTITADTPFYLNQDGNVVISFPEYSIAPGYMGIQEFVIS